MSKTYHTQTARFIAAIAEAMPINIRADVMQGWIENPKALREALFEALCSPETESRFLIDDRGTVGKLGAPASE